MASVRSRTYIVEGKKKKKKRVRVHIHTQINLNVVCLSVEKKQLPGVLPVIHSLVFSLHSDFLLGLSAELW